MIVHIVMLKFKDENKEANLQSVKEQLETLESKIPSLNFMEVGINFDEAPRAFDLSLYATFDTKEDLKAYDAHEEHQRVLSFIKQVIVESKVVDYIK